MNKRFFILVLCFAIFLPGVLATVTNITSCSNTGTTITASGQYAVINSITSNTSCITVNADNVEIDCFGNTISYGLNGANGAIGINAVHGVIPRYNLTVKNCIINDVNVSGTTGYGIYLVRFSNSYIFNNTIKTNGTTTNHGIFLTTTSNNNIIENNTVIAWGSSTGNFGIHLISASMNNTIKGNNVLANGTTTSYALFISTNSENNTINNNTFLSHQTTATGNLDGNTVYFYRSKHNVFTNNYVYGRSAARNYVVYLRENVDDTDIINNTIINNATEGTSYGIYQTYSDDNVIVGNNILALGTTPIYGIYLLASQFNNVTNNLFNVSATGASNNGIYIANSYDNLVQSNNVSVSGTTPLYGIYMLYSERNVVDLNDVTTYGTTANAPMAMGISATNNTITNNTFKSRGTTTLNYGVYLTQASYNFIEGNNITTNGTTTNYGVYFLTSVKRNVVRNNLVNTNGTTTNYGVYLSDALYNDFIGNNISTGGVTINGNTNNWGIYLASNSMWNEFYNNTINTSGASLNYGIQLLTNSRNNVFSGNTVDTNGNGTSNIGFYVSESHNNIFDDNTISTNGSGTDYGFYLHSSSRNNSIKNNIISTVGAATSHAFDFLFITPGYPENNTLQNNTLLVINGKKLNLETSGINGTWIVDQDINNYTLTTAAIINFENTSAGKIAFTQMLTSTTGLNLTNQVYITDNLASINESNAGLNKTADITLYNRPTNLNNLSIYRNGDVCPATICVNLTSMSAGNVTFNVTKGGNYSILASNTISPTVLLNLPSEALSTSSQNISFNFTATDDNSTILDCDLYLDSVLNQTNSSVGNGTLTNFDILGISEANHGWYVNCFDNTNNSGVSETRNFTILISTPTIALDYPLSDAYLDNTNFTLLNYTVYDADLRSMTVWLYGDGSLINTTSNVQNGTSWSYNLTNLTIGLHNWTVITNNGIKNSSTSTQNFYIINLALTCEVGGPYQDGALVLIQGNVSNGTLAVSSQTINASVYVNGALNTSKNITSSSDGSFQTTFSGLVIENYTLNVSIVYQGINKYCLDNFSINEGYNAGFIAGNESGYILGFNEGNITGFNLGNITGFVLGNVTGFGLGNTTGYILGNATGFTQGYSLGNTTGFILGNESGYILGNATGFTLGNYTGFILGNTTGFILGNITGFELGNATGFVLGNYTGYILGNLTGFNLGNQTGYESGYNAGFIAGNNGPASLILDKIASIQNLTNDAINLNITLRLTNKGRSNATNTNITDPDSLISPYDLGTITAGSSTVVNYIKGYTRNSTTYNSSLAVSQGLGIDSYTSSLLSSNSSLIIVTIPSTTADSQLTLVKNAYFNSENSTSTNYTITIEVINSGGEDLSGITLIDSDLGLNTLIDLNRTQSYNSSGYVIIDKAASNEEELLVKATATVNSVTYESNQINLLIPGYGGPADTYVYTSSYLAPSTSFNPIIKIINMNPDIGQNFVLDYWITNNAETTNYSLGQVTVYVASLNSTNVTLNLTTPGDLGIYKVKALVSYTNGLDTAFSSFEITSDGLAPSSSSSSSSSSGSSGGGGSSSTRNQTQNKTTPGETVSEEEIVCNKPYIRHGKECCLDKDNNSICDEDEEENDTTKTNETTSDGFNKNYLLFSFLIAFLVFYTLSLLIFKARKTKEILISSQKTDISKIIKRIFISLISLAILFVFLFHFVDVKNLIKSPIQGEVISIPLEEESISAILPILALALILGSLFGFITSRIGKFSLKNPLRTKGEEKNSLSSLIEKEIYTDSGEEVGVVKEVIVLGNKIEGLRIQLADKNKERFNIDKIFIKYDAVKDIGKIVIINEEILNKIDEVSHS